MGPARTYVAPQQYFRVNLLPLHHFSFFVSFIFCTPLTDLVNSAVRNFAHLLSLCNLYIPKIKRRKICTTYKEILDGSMKHHSFNISFYNRTTVLVKHFSKRERIYSPQSLELIFFFGVRTIQRCVYRVKIKSSVGLAGIGIVYRKKLHDTQDRGGGGGGGVV